MTTAALLQSDIPQASHIPALIISDLAEHVRGRRVILATVKERIYAITPIRQTIFREIGTGKVGFIYLPEGSFIAGRATPQTEALFDSLQLNEVYVLALVIEHANLWRGELLGRMGAV